MSKAYEIMTKSLATCRPDDNAADVARIMKDRDIGDVLVVEDGKLLGIITDRDLAVNALTDNHDANSTPISKYMSTDLVTGAAQWGLNKIAKTMSKNQVRRLPIVEDGEVVGIISLGDIARYNGRKDVVTESLRNISRPNNASALLKNGSMGRWLGLSFLGLVAGASYWLTMSHNGQQFRKQMLHNKTYKNAMNAVNMAGERVIGRVNMAGESVISRVNEAASSKEAKHLRRQIRSNIRDLSSQLPTISYKPPKNRPVWFK
jgi:CBS domain-containing protein